MKLPNSGKVTLVGYGSLLNEASVKTSCPDYTNFRQARLPGFKRLFNKVQIFCLRNGVDPKQNKQAAVLSIRPDPKVILEVSLFEAPHYAIPEFMYREHDYRPQVLKVEEASGKLTEALGYVGFADEADFRANQSPLSKAVWDNWAEVYDGPVYQTDLLPSTRYLELCLTGARSLGKTAYENFLDTTLLADGKTTLRNYLATQNN